MERHGEQAGKAAITEIQSAIPTGLGWLLFYAVLTFTLTWSVLIPTLALVPEERQTPLIVIVAFGPFIAAVITIWIARGQHELRNWLRRIFRLRIPITLYLAGAFVLPLLFGGLHYGLYRVLGGPPDFANASPWYWYLAYLIPTTLLTGGNEEPGWRGFALPALLARFPPIVASLILGVIHSLWHLPLMEHYNTNLGWYIFNVIPLTVFLNWFYLRSRGSVIPVALLHASTNVMSEFLPTPTDVLGGFGTWMVLRGLVYWGIATVIVITTKGRLGWERDALSTEGQNLPGSGVPPAPAQT